MLSSAELSQTLQQTDFAVEVHGQVAVTSFTDNSTVQVHGQTLRASFRSIEVWLDEADGWRMISSQTLAVPQDPPSIALPPEALDDYVGTYLAGDAVMLRITRKGDGLLGSRGGDEPFPIKVEVRDVLFSPGQPRLRRIAVRDAKGRVTGLLIRREGRDLVLKRAD